MAVAALVVLFACTALFIPIPHASAVSVEDFEDPTQEFTQEQRTQLEQELKAAEQRASAIPGTGEKTSCNFFSDSPGCAIYWFLDIVSDFFINILLSWVVLMFEAAVNLALVPLASITFVKVGFGITLGIANMFFVLVLLWIAIATIFDFEPYTAKQLLPRLIVAALLINFSLAIGSAFVSLSNGIAKVFYNQLQGPLTPTEEERQGVVGRFLPLAPIASRVMLASKFAVVKDTRPPKEPATLAQVGQQIERDCYTNLSAVPGVGIAQCLSSVFDGWWKWAWSAPLSDTATATTALTAVLYKLVITPILIFVLLAGGVFLMSRTLSLAFLLVFGPLAFLSMILPATRPFYNQWWEKLARWSLFFPAFMFCIFLTLQAGSSFAQAFVTSGAGGSADRLPAFMQYTLFIGLLLGSLAVANQASLIGAGTVVGWGKKLSGATGQWARGTGKILGAGIAGAALGSAAGQRLAANRYTRWALRPVEAAQAAGQKVRDDREKTARQRRLMASKASPDYRWALMQGMVDSEKADFIRDLKPHQLKQVMEVATAQKRIELHEGMKKFDLEDRVRDAAPNLTALVEMETQTPSSDASRFQDAFNSWIGSATKQDLQKHIEARDIRGNVNLQAALKAEGIIDIDDFRTIGNTHEKSEAFRDFLTQMGGGNLGQGLTDLMRTNRKLAEDIRDKPGVYVRLARGIALGKKVRKGEWEPPEPPPPPAPGGTP